METIINESTRYTIVLFDKYILCSIKNYLTSDIMFAPIDKLGRHNIKSYISEKILRNEVGHHLVQWFINLEKMKKYSGAKAQGWWDDIIILDNILKEAGFEKGIKALYTLDPNRPALSYCIDNKFIKIAEIKEQAVLTYRED